MGLLGEAMRIIFGGVIISRLLYLSGILVSLAFFPINANSAECETGIISHKIINTTPSYVEVEVTYCYGGEFGKDISIGGVLLAHDFPEQEVMKSYPVKKGKHNKKFKISRLPKRNYSHQTEYIKIFIKTGPPTRVKVANKTVKFIHEWPEVSGELDSFTSEELKNKIRMIEINLNDVNRTGRYQIADVSKGMLDEILQTHDKYIPAYIQLARYYLLTDRNLKGTFKINDSAGIRKSEEILRLALSIDSQDKDVKVFLAYILSLQGKYGEADKIFSSLINTYKRNYRLYSNYGIHLYRKKQTKEAIKVLNKTLLEKSTKYPGHMEHPEYADGNFRAQEIAVKVLIIIHKNNNDYDSLEKTLQKAISIFKSNCYRYQYAEIKQNRYGDYETAIRTLKAPKYGRSTCEAQENTVITKSLYMKWAKENDESSYIKAKLKDADMSVVIRDFTRSKYLLPIIDKLLKKGHDINSKNKRNLSALGLCIKESDINCVEKLLELGANVNEELNGDGVTPLILAVAYNNVDLVKVLIKHNANVDLETKQGVTARALANSRNNSQIVNLLNKPRGI